MTTHKSNFVSWLCKHNIGSAAGIPSPEYISRAVNQIDKESLISNKYK